MHQVPHPFTLSLTPFPFPSPFTHTHSSPSPRCFPFSPAALLSKFLDVSNNILEIT